MRDDDKAAPEAQGKVEPAVLGVDYALIFNASSNGMSFTEMGSGKIVDVNDAWIRATGIARENAIGRTAFELGVWSRAEERDACVAQLRGLGLVHEFEAQLVTRSGVRPFLLSARPVEMGGKRYALWELRDITALKQAEEVVQRSQERLRLAQEAAHVGVWELDTVTGAAYWSPECERLYGLEPGTLSEGQQWRDCVHPDDLHLIDAQWELRIAKGEPFEVEYRLRKADGEMRWLLSKGRAQYDAQGKPVRLTGINMDITERKRAEQALRTSEHLLRDAQEAARIGCYAMNMETGAWEGTPVLDALFGITADYPHTIEGWVNFIHPDFDEPMSDYLRAVIRDRKPFDAEYKVFRPSDGAERWMHGLGRISYDQEGNAVTLTGTVQDITERKQIEAARLRAEAQLRESQKMEALGIMAGGVAHDFNNALAVIIGNLALVRQDVGPGHVALEGLDEIGRAAERARNLVQQILTFGRRQAVERKVIALGPVVQEAARLLRSTIPAGVRVNVACMPDVPDVLADAAQIAQVVINLCNNAWHATEGLDRTGLITVSLVRGDLGGQPCAVLAVRDNGRGMDEETRAHIFEPFFTTKPVNKGTGLGLSVVHGIAQEHDARIGVESTPGTGTTFTLRFPAAQAASRVRDGAGEPQRGGVPAAPVQQRRTPMVLCLDDEAAIVSLMSRLLEREGYQVRGFELPQQALAALHADPQAYDLVITDYNMPGMSGIEVARAVKALRADLPVVIASGYLDDEARQKATMAGAEELVDKPYTAVELREVALRVLGPAHTD